MDIDEALAPLAGRPGFLLSRVGAAVQAGFKEVLERWEIRPMHFLLLVVLDGIEGASQQELCHALAVDSGNMVALIDRLAELGYAQRSRHPGDRRRHVVTITGPGRRTLAEATAATETFDNEFLSPLTQPERDRLITLLGKLYAPTPEARRQAPPLGTGTAGQQPPH